MLRLTVEKDRYGPIGTHYGRITELGIRSVQSPYDEDFPSEVWEGSELDNA